MKRDFRGQKSRPARDGITLVELMVSLAVLALLVAMIGQLLNSVMVVSLQGGKRMDGDAQSRAVFDRMAIDFAQIVKRSDVDYFLKDTSNNPMAGNDNIAFYSQVPGYSSASASQQATDVSPLSLVAYRINSQLGSPFYNHLERLGYALQWNGSSVTSDATMIYSASGTSYGTSSTNTLCANWLSNSWPMSTIAGNDPTHEELIGPEVFRMEYYYTLRGQAVSTGTFPGALTTSTLSSQLSATPWYVAPVPTGIQAHTSVNGLEDVAGITVVIAVIDPRSRALVTDAQLVTLAGNMQDFDSSMSPGDLEAHWRTVINAAAGIPKLAAQAIRVYRRDFILPQN